MVYLPGVSVGQKVMYQQYAGHNAGDPTTPYTSEDDPIMMDEAELLAVVED